MMNLSLLFVVIFVVVAVSIGHRSSVEKEAEARTHRSLSAELGKARSSPRATRRCPNTHCGRVTRREARFCPQCGTSLH
jgi:hypothetical protein